MFEAGQNWELFGYDMRHLGSYWSAAWRDLLWGHDSPLRERLDEVVTLHDDTGTRTYQAGRICDSAAGAQCSAVLLPDELVLSKRLSLPISAESELASVLAYEVRASSPFAVDDTGWGWAVLARDETRLQVALAIVSKSATMAYLGRQHSVHDVHSHEVWVAAEGGAMVVVQGFGEQARETRYRSRLLRCALMLGIAAILLVAVAGVAAAFKGVQLQRLEAISETVSRNAAEASRLKSRLAAANETISAANEVVRQYPNPHVEIARLTRLLNDDASLANFSMSGSEIRLRGRAVDAASVMQQLTDVPDYLEVTAPQAIARLGDTGFEQFYLNIRLDAGAAR